MDLAKNLKNVSTLAADNLSCKSKAAEKRHGFIVSGTSAATNPTICHIFERVVSMYPACIAVEHGIRRVTYQNLDYASTQFARRLIRIGIQKGEILPVLSNRSLGMIVALLAILKIGACIVPMDFETWSHDRIQKTLEVTQCRYTVTTRPIEIPTSQLIVLQDVDLEEMLSGPTEEKTVSLTTESPATGSSTNDSCMPDRGDLAYMIFTSGTTAEPKGVMIPHSAIAHYVQQGSAEAPFNMNVDPSSRVMLVFSVAFDACLGVILSTICNGGTLVLASSTNYATVAMTCTTLPLTPTILATLRPGSDYDSVTSIFLGGENPSPKIVRPWQTRQRRIFNCYGPTETTCTSIITQISQDKPPHLRHTVEGSSVAILDKSLTEASEGEIAISGPGLAVGYFKNDVMTTQKFINYNGLRYYLTGDYGRKTEFGIEFLGRKDRVVKNRGFLINLDAEVEAVIANMGMVDSVTAVMHQGRLIAFVTPENIDANFLRIKLLEFRDAFLVPDRVYPVTSFPMTPNGKVNLASLTRLLDEEQSRNVVGDHTTESSELNMVLKGFNKVLALPMSTLSGNSSFFELGGNSLAAVGLVSYLRERCLSISVRHVFQLDTAQRICDNLSSVDSFVPMISMTDAAELEALREDVRRAGYPITHDMEVARMSAIQVKMIQSTIMLPSMNYIQLSMTFDLTSGGFTSEAFRQAWETITERHSIFRATFIPSLEATVIERSTRIDWDEIFVDHEDWESTVNVTQKQMIPSLGPLDTDHPKPHNKLRLVTEANTRTEFIWTVHHSLVDGWSVAVIIQELQSILAQEKLPDAPQFSTVVALQRKLAQQVIAQAGKDSGFGKPQDYLSALSLKLPKPRIWAPGARAERRQVLAVNKSQLGRFVQHHRVSDVSVFLASWALVLSKYLGTYRVAFGVVLSRRNLPMAAVERVVGPLLETVPLPVDTTPTQSTAEFLRVIHDTLHNINDHHGILAASRKDVGQELLETLVALQYDLPDSTWNLDDQIWPSPHAIRHSETTELPLHILIDKHSGNGLVARFLYDRSRFDEAMISQMLDHFANAFRAFLTCPTVELVMESMMSQIEVNELLSSPDLDEPFEGPSSLKSAFEAAADSWPDSIALEGVSRSLSYKELDRTSNAVANTLSSLVGPGHIVGILSDGSIEWVTAIIAVLKTGAAYCPIDSGLPSERVKVILRESGCSLLLCTTKEHSEAWAQHSGLTCLAIESVLSKSPLCSKRLPDVCSAHDTAVVVFTSGSTGVPKGILLEHIGILSLLEVPNARLRSRPGRRIAQFLSLGFDCCVNEVFATLCYGATLVLKNPSDPVQHLQHVDAMMCTPSFLATLSVGDFPNLDLIALAGEPVPQKLVDTWGHDRILLNVYAPSECTISAVYPQLLPGTKVTLGRPVPRMAIYVLDRNLNPVPSGVPGEICISGIQVTRGYLNREEETKAKFVKNPYHRNWKLYRSGDMGRLNASREIEYIGRVDNQVKVRGFRIELEEIESTISTLCPEVHQVVVAVANDTLIGFVTPESLNTFSIQAMIAKNLPAYCQPSYFVALKAIPMSTNQKADRKRILLMGFQPNHHTAMPIMSDTEKTIQKIWKDLIHGLGNIGALDHFLQIGGHSLLQAKVARHLGMVLGHRIPLRMVIENPVLRDLATAADKLVLESGESDQVAQILSEDTTVLSHLEEEMYMLHMLSSETSTFNVPYVARLTGPLNLAALEAALINIVGSNAVLRSRYQINNGRLSRSISSSVAPAMRRYCSVTEEIFHDIANRPFQLGNDQLIRFYLYVEGPNTTYFVVNMSHMIGDRSTLGAILQLVEVEYTRTISNDDFDRQHTHSLALPYSAWTKLRQTRQIEPSLTRFWQDSIMPCLKDPPFFEDYRLEKSCGFHRRIRIDTELSVQLKTWRSKHLATGHQLAIAAVGLTMHHLSSRKNFIIAAPIEDRTDPVGEDMLGLFLDRIPIPLRFDSCSLESFGSLIDMTKSASEEAIVNYVPLVDLKHLLDLTGKSHSLCEIMVTYHASELEGPRLPGIDVMGVPIRPRGAKFPLMFEFSEFPDSITIDLEYDTQVVDQVTVEQIESALLDVFQHLSSALAPSTVLSHRRVSTFAPNRNGNQKKVDIVREAMAICLELKRSDISCSRSFFDLGGSSVDCLRLHDLLQKSGISVPLASVIRLQTAELIAGAGK